MLSLVMAIALSLRLDSVQTWLTSQVSQLIWERAHIDVRVGRVGISGLADVVLNDVHIADLAGDTLIHAAEARVSMLGINLNNNAYRLRRAYVRGAYVNLNMDTVLNISALIHAAFPPDTAKGAPFEFSIGQIEIDDTRFRFGKTHPQPVERGVNYDDMRLRNIHIAAHELRVVPDTVALCIESLSFVEQSGLVVEELRADFSICPQQMRFGRLRIVSGYNNLSLREFSMSYNGYHTMSNFIDNVVLYGDFVDSRVNLNYIGHFAPVLMGIDVPLRLNGTVRGPVSDLNGRGLRIEHGENTLISTNIRITGLPHIDQTLFNARINELCTSSADLGGVRRADGHRLLRLPEMLHELGELRYKGEFIGYLKDFVLYGSLRTRLGSLRLDASILPNGTGGYRYNGHVEAHAVDVGQLTHTHWLGKTTFSTQVDGYSNAQGDIELSTIAHVDALEANGYQFSNIDLNGMLTNHAYVGHIDLNDPNCQLHFEGALNFADTIPSYDFTARVGTLNLVALNINQADSISEAAFELKAKGSGSKLANAQGDVQLLNASYRNQRGDFTLDQVAFEALITADSMHTITLRSEPLDAELRTSSLASMGQHLMSALGQYLPSIAQKHTAVGDLDNAHHEVQLNAKQTNLLTSILLPQLQLSPQSSAFGLIAPNELLLEVDVPALRFGSLEAQQLKASAQGLPTALMAALHSPQMSIGAVPLRNINLHMDALHDTVGLHLDWDNQTKAHNMGQIAALIDLKGHGQQGHIAHIDLRPTSFTLNDSAWSIVPASISIDTGGISLHQLHIDRLTQSLWADGRISALPTDTLHLALHNMNLAALNLYLSSMGYNMEGSITGTARATGLYGQPNLLANLRIDDLTLNQRPIGTVTLGSQWHNAEHRMGVELLAQRDGINLLRAEGSVWPNSGSIDLEAQLQQVGLHHLAPLLQGSVSNLAGSVSGQVKATGQLRAPSLNGELQLHDAQAMVDVLRTQYTTSGRVQINDSGFDFKNFAIYDINGHEALLNGRIDTERFKSLGLNLNLRPRNFQCMNTTERDNPAFYATAYATGMVVVSGNAQRVNFDIYARTEPNTVINLPLGSNKTVEESSYITFVRPSIDSTATPTRLPPAPTKPSTEVNLNMEFSVTPEATAQLSIDKKMNDIIRANGRGNIKVELNPSRNILRLMGSYEIERGDYMFNLRNMMSKKFSIARGSSISWSGDPLDANTDITATYNLKASLRPLLGDEYTARVPVDCQIKLSQKLLAPQIAFGISLPNGTADERDALAIALNTQEKLNTQFLSLLALNSFMADAGMGAGPAEGNSSLSTTGINTVSELLFNQLSNQLSGLFNDKLNLGLNYRRGAEEELTKDQVEVAVSAQAFNDRLTFNGSAFNNNSLNSTAAPIAGNINAEWKINKSGKLKAKVFARYNDDFLNTLTTTENEYTTGAGFSYSEEFNNFRDLLFRIKHLFSSTPAPSGYRPEEEEETEEASPAQP